MRKNIFITSIAAVSLLLSVAEVARCTSIELRPVAETFVLNPGSGNSFSNAADHNYGGSGSRCVSAASASAYSVSEGIDDEPKGEFDSILKFDTSAIAGMNVSELTLTLNISNGNRSAFDIFNYLGHSGDFGVYLMTSDWEIGSGTPSSDATSTVGVTYNSLQDILADNEPTLLDTFYYDAANPYGSPELYSFSLSLTNQDLIDVLYSGQELSLLLLPEDDEVCFNFTSYVQHNADPSKNKYRDQGAILDVVVPEPSVMCLLTFSGLVMIRKNRVRVS